MDKKTLRDLSLVGKRVLCRVAYDVPLKKHGSGFVVDDDARIKATIPTLRYLLKKKCRIVLLTWAGRPKGRVEPKLKLDPVARRLEKLIGRKVIKLNDCVGPEVERRLSAMKPGQIVLLENVRFHPEENANDKKFISALCRLGEVWVFEAFAQAHRNVSSIVGPPRHLPSGVGFLVANEVKALSCLMKKPAQPYVTILGGAKISTRIKLVKELAKTAQTILLGGALANTVFKAMGLSIGRSLYEPKMIPIWRSLKISPKRVPIPIDVVTALSLRSGVKATTKLISEIGSRDIILDIGPETVKLYSQYISQAKTIIWNGPLGYFENPTFAKATNRIATAVGRAKAQTIVGGGDTIDALKDAGLLKKVNFVSTGGGAMLDFLTGDELPGLKYIDSK
ncbi:phosphoglycerate kinase [Patescibacteria group bacterium]|nr:phosphoglycerate kinase [Patescibacteria group bacterium]MBU1889879.1 phosphoglycerate kinase [Patescibacteria group bacterium]